jgi:hypothetical protein
MYPKKIISDYVKGKITRKKFEQQFSVFQKTQGLNFTCKGYCDMTGTYIVYRNQKAELKNGLIFWNYGKKKTASSFYEFRRKVDRQIMKEQMRKQEYFL